MSELATGKKSKKWIIFVIIGVITALAITLGVIFISKAVKTSRSNNELNIGNKYLDELDYKEAIAHYKEAIAINPANLQAYIGIYDAYSALADNALAELDYDHAIKYFDEATDILKSGREYVKDGALDEMIDDLHDRKKEAKAQRDGNGNISTGSANPGSSTTPDNLDEKIAENTALLDVTIADVSNGYFHMLGSLATYIALNEQNGFAYIDIPALLSGSPIETARFMLPSGESGTAYSYSADWCTHYYDEDMSYGCWYYAIPLSEAVAGAYSITGQNVDFASYDWSSSYSDIYVDYYNGEQCLIIRGGWAGWIGSYLTAQDISAATYVGDNTWMVTAIVNEVSDGYDSIACNVPYCDVDIYFTPDENSCFGFIITDCSVRTLHDNEWVTTYNQFLAQYKNNLSGMYSSYVKYDLLYIDGDDIPELVISEGGMDAYYIYTIKNGVLTMFNCAQIPDFNDENYLFVASWVGGTSGYAEYVPYASQLLVTHNDQDFAGQVYYYYTEFFDGNLWQTTSEGKTFLRDENGHLGPDVQYSIDQGFMSADEYDYAYDVPGYDPTANWQLFELRYSITDFYYYY